MKATEFIGRLVVRFLDDVQSSSSIYSFREDDEDGGFRHACSVCNFIKSCVPMSDWLKIGEEELETMRMIIDKTGFKKVSTFNLHTYIVLLTLI